MHDVESRGLRGPCPRPQGFGIEGSRDLKTEAERSHAEVQVVGAAALARRAPIQPVTVLSDPATTAPWSRPGECRYSRRAASAQSRDTIASVAPDGTS